MAHPRRADRGDRGALERADGHACGSVDPLADRPDAGTEDLRRDRERRSDPRRRAQRHPQGGTRRHGAVFDQRHLQAHPDCEHHGSAGGLRAGDATPCRRWELPHRHGHGVLPARPATAAPGGAGHQQQDRPGAADRDRAAPRRGRAPPDRAAAALEPDALPRGAHQAVDRGAARHAELEQPHHLRAHRGRVAPAQHRGPAQEPEALSHGAAGHHHHPAIRLGRIRGRAPRGRRAGLDGDRQRIRGPGGAARRPAGRGGGAARGAGAGAARAAGPHARRGPRERRAGRRRDRPPARPVCEDLLRAPPPRLCKLRPGGEHRAAGTGRRGGGDRGGGAAAAVDVSTLGTACAVPAACALVSGCARGPAPAPSLAAESAPPIAVMAVEPYGGLLYVRGVVNRDSAWLILDTGTSHTGLDREWAWTAGALPVAAPGAPATQVAETASAAVVDTMHLAGLALASYQVALYALRGVSEASGRPERGFVGHDVLRRFTVEIDYREQRVRLYDPARYRYAGSGTVVPFAADDDRPLLHGSITVPGRPPIPARLLLDTGASGLCLILTVPFVERYGLAGAVSPAIEAPIGTGLAGQLRGTLVRLKELRLAGLRVASPTTGLGGERTGFLARSDLDGVIGNPVFEDSRLIVDYARRRVIIEPRDAAAAAFAVAGY